MARGAGFGDACRVVALAELFDELRAIAEGVGVEVRVESYSGAFPDGQAPRGGLCTVRGKRRIVVDSAAGLGERIAVLGAAIGLLGVDMKGASAQARATVGAHGKRALPGPRPTRPQPLARARRRKVDER